MCRSGSPKTKPLSTTFENNNPFLECDCPPPSTDNNKPMIKWTRRKGLTSSSSESRNLASSASESSDWSDIIVDSEESSVSVANSRSGNKGLLEAAVLDSVFRKRSLSSSQVSLFNITVSDPNMNLLIKKWPADFRLKKKKKKKEGRFRPRVVSASVEKTIMNHAQRFANRWWQDPSLWGFVSCILVTQSNWVSAAFGQNTDEKKVIGGRCHRNPFQEHSDFLHTI